MSSTWPQQLGMPGIPVGLTAAYSGAPGATTFDLTAGYTYGTSGRAVAIMSFLAPETANLTDFWVRVTAYGGTWGSTDGNLNWEIRDGLNGSRKPGTSQVATGTFAPGGTTGWKQVTGLTAALTIGKMYVLVIWDSDGGATNYATIACRYGTSGHIAPIAAEVGTTTDGFSTAWSLASSSPACVVKVGSTYVAGQIHDTSSTVANGALERGHRFRPKENCTLIGVYNALDAGLLTAGHTFKLYADGTNPGGSTLAAYTQNASTLGGGTSPSITSLLFPSSSWYDLVAGTWYRFVMDPTGAITTPRQLTVGGSPDATLLAAAMPMGGDMYWTAESGGVFVDDSSALCSQGPILVPNTDSGGAKYRPRMRRAA